MANGRARGFVPTEPGAHSLRVTVCGWAANKAPHFPQGGIYIAPLYPGARELEVPSRQESKRWTVHRLPPSLRSDLLVFFYKEPIVWRLKEHLGEGEENSSPSSPPSPPRQFSPFSSPPSPPLSFSPHLTLRLLPLPSSSRPRKEASPTMGRSPKRSTGRCTEEMPERDSSWLCFFSKRSN